MSPSDVFPFSVQVTSGPQRSMSTDSTITLLDGHDNVRGTARGTLTLDLPPGLYVVQVERAGSYEEEVHRHEGPTTVELSEPMRYSAVPTNDTASSHEYYQAPASEWSKSPTAPAISVGGYPTTSLFVFLRAPSSTAVTGSLDNLGLRVLDYSGTEHVVLGAGNTKSDSDAGWLAFNAVATAGEYVLRYDPPGDGSGPAREMAIAVFPGRQTQVFMTLADGPSFASASVLMGRGFDPDDRVSQAVDSALTGLQNGVDLLLPDERNMLLHGKFANPMLGLVGAHALFLAPEPERSVIEEVLGNLGYLLGADAPDVRALRFMAARRFGMPADTKPFERPPMMRAGLEAVLEAAARLPDLVPSGGLLARIARQRFVDSPWSTWKPLFVEDVSGTRGTVDRRRWHLPRPLEVALGRDRAPSAVPAPDWVSEYVSDAALQAARRDREFDIEAVAERASLPLATVSEAYEELRAAMEPGPRRTIEMERLVSHSRREAAELDIDIDQARRTFFDGTAGDRVRALGWMQGDSSIQDFAVALDGVVHSRSAFEQYHALRLSRQMIPMLDDEQRKALGDALAQQRGPGEHITPGSDRWYLSNQILSQLDIER